MYSQTANKIDPAQAYSATSLFSLLPNTLGPIFKTDSAFREFLHRDRLKQDLFKSKVLSGNDSDRRIVIQGSDVIAGFKTLAGIIGADLLDPTTFHAYSTVQRVSDYSNGVFEDWETITSLSDVKVFIVRGAATHEDKAIASKQTVYFFKRQYVVGARMENKPTLNRGKDCKILVVNKACLAI